MYGVLLQKLTKISGSLANQTVTQGEEGWLDVSQYQDAIFWIEAPMVSLPGAVTMGLSVETSPLKEDAYFLPLFVPFQPTPSRGVTNVVLATKAGATMYYPPISNWLRWKIVTGGSVTGMWSVTLRIWVALNAVGSKGRALQASMSDQVGSMNAQIGPTMTPGVFRLDMMPSRSLMQAPSMPVMSMRMLNSQVISPLRARSRR